MSEAKRRGKDLLSCLRAENLTEYGSVIPAEKVHAALGISIPASADRRTYERLALLELGAVDYVRNVLLGEGKYLAQSNGDYRILTPGENATQIRRYVEHADNKIKRALKLWRNTPVVDGAAYDNMGARLLLKQEGIKNRSILGHHPSHDKQ